MLRNYLVIAWRNLWKNKVFALINILGLAAAIGGSLLLTLTSFRELSYDRFHERGDRIYRVYKEAFEAEGPDRSAAMPTPMLPAIEEAVPELAGAVRVGGGGASVEIDGQVMEVDITFTGPDYFEMFSFPVVRGKQQGLLSSRSEAVITESLAERLFGADEAVGQPLRYRLNGVDYAMEVSAVIRDIPPASSLDNELVVRFENHPSFVQDRDRWDNQYHSVFVMLQPGQAVEQVEDRLDGVVDKYFTEEVGRLAGEGGQADASGRLMRLRLQPLFDLHFDTDIEGDGMSRMYPVGLLVVVAFILIIAAINFVNLTLGGAIRRAREVGLRKVMGASRRQLIVQFWGEALLIAFLGLLAGVALAQVLLPEYNSMFRKSLSLWQPQLLAAILLILAVIGLAGGGYPAFILSRFPAADVLRGTTQVQRPGRLRDGLVLVQFSLSILLIACTLIVSQQLSYLKNKPLGYNKEQVISIPLGQAMDGRKAIERLRRELASQPGVLSVSGTFRNFGRGKDGGIVTSVVSWEQGDRHLESYWMPVDYRFLQTMGIELLEGRALDPQRGTDSTSAIIVNETFARQISGEDSPLGLLMELDPPREVVGVVRDFHFQSLAQPIRPLSLLIHDDFPIFYALVRVQPDRLATTMERLEATWTDLYPQHTFMGSFIDENVDRLYRGEQVMGQLAISASLLAILLSCMGLFGIALMVTAQRTKEIGIRKVLGATTTQIVTLLTSDFMRLVLIALLVATPVAWYLMRTWLDTYAFRIDLQWWVFLMAGLLAAGIAMITLSWHALRAAHSNPVRALRSE